MDFADYQEKARKTAIYPNRGKNFIYPTLGLVGEAGEVAEKVKKALRDEGGVISRKKRQELAKELGDVLWYLANLAHELNLSLEQIASDNLAKLASRQKRNRLQGEGDNR